MNRVIEGFVLAVMLTALPVGLARAAQDNGALAEANKLFDRGNKFVEDGSLPRAKQEFEKALNMAMDGCKKIYEMQKEAFKTKYMVVKETGEE